MTWMSDVHVYIYVKPIFAFKICCTSFVIFALKSIIILLLDFSMYDRALRNLTVLTGSTAEHVGPGTYDAEGVDPKRLRAGKS